MTNSKKTILVIGGAGFIGSHLSEAFLNLGHRVIVIDNFSTSAIKKIGKTLKIYKTDIENINKVRKIFKKEKPDIVYHLAGAINLRRQITDPLFINSLNFLERTKIILDCCKENKVKKFIFLSSGGAIYDNAKIIPTPENYPAHPTSLYGLANLMIEEYIKLYDKEHRLDYTILRLSNVYGPRQWKTGIIPSIIIKLLKKEKPIIYGDGNQSIDFVYINDVISACILTISKGKKEIYNVGSGKDVSINKIFSMIKEILNLKIKPKYKKSTKEESRKSALDIRKIKKELGWQSKTSFKEGLLRTIERFKQTSPF